ncbi:MAG: hypothetical protein U9Q80_04840 [Bacillota bacterium]|nr:hypothetical protein [Bacillota bacterium]
MKSKMSLILVVVLILSVSLSFAGKSNDAEIQHLFNNIKNFKSFEVWDNSSVQFDTVILGENEELKYNIFSVVYEYKIIGYIITDIKTETIIEFALGESPFENLIDRDENMGFLKIKSGFNLKKIGINNIYTDDECDYIVNNSDYANNDNDNVLSANEIIEERTIDTNFGIESLDYYEYIISDVPDIDNTSPIFACGPVSGMNLVYYWDDNGYGNLIVSGDTHSSVYTELYDDMHTLANATDPNWYDDGLDAYFDRHNYDLPFTSDFNPTISEFTTIKNQIDDDNPGTILFNSSSSYGAHYTTLVGYAVDEAVDEQYYIIHDLWWDTSENIYRNWDNDVYYDDVVWGYYLFDIN